MYRNIDPKDLRIAVSDIAERWMLITAGTPERCNTMTASWGAVGELWGVPMATIYIRPQRYTKEFVDQSDYFTLCFFPEDVRQRWYDGDYHYMYFGEIIEVLEQVPDGE